MVVDGRWTTLMMQYGSDSPFLSATIMSCLDGREEGERVSRRVGERLSG